jgi:hypothetical protein
MQKALTRIVSAITLAAWSGAVLAAGSYEFHHVVRGLVKAAPPVPPCIDPSAAAVGDISDRFCGHEGWDLYNVGVVGGRGILLSATDDSTGAKWGSYTDVDVPGVPTCSPTNSASTCAKDTDGPSYTAAMAQHYSTKSGAVSVCISKGEGWHLPSYGEMYALRNPGQAVYGGLNMSPGYYWAATEAGINASWGMTVGGGRSTQLKTNLFPVRCARTY